MSLSYILCILLFFCSIVFTAFIVVLLQHVTAEGTALVKQAEDAASNKKVCFLVIIVFFYPFNFLFHKYDVGY